ncbi:hypothetical protein [EBPR siphovirus 2]|nr:hypothetical protein [EBPR siphovirus 2]
MKISVEQAADIQMAAAHSALRAINLSIEHGSVQSGFTIMTAALTEFARQTADQGHAGDVIQLIADEAVKGLSTMPPLLGVKR